MRRQFNEQIFRMYSLIYGENKVKSKLNTIKEQAEKAELVTDDVAKFFENLKNVKTPLSQQQRGSMNFQKDVETVQIALILLGYELPRFGVDGLYGPETARAVEKFKADNGLNVSDVLSESKLFRILNELEMVQLADTSYSNVKFDNDSTKYDSVNKALLDDLQKAAQAADLTVTITTAKSGHKHNVKDSDRMSRHMTQTAVDISIINGVNSGGASNQSDGNPKFRELGNKLKDALVELGYVWNKESGNNKAVLWQTNAGGNHYNHLHISNNSGASSAELSGNSQLSVVTADMVNLLYEKLKSENISSDDLRRYVETSKMSGSLEGLSAGDFDAMMNIIIEKLEGGYYHPDMLADGRIRDSRYGGSGETMFGIDRKAGNWEQRYAAGKEFFAILDSVNARKNWTYNYMGGQYRSRLQKLATEMIKSEYIKNSENYLSDESKSIVSSSPELTFNFIYATYNGPGWFQRFANTMNNLVQSGTTDPETLSKLLIDRRKNSGNSLIAQSGKKIENFINSNLS